MLPGGVVTLSWNTPRLSWLLSLFTWVFCCCFLSPPWLAGALLPAQSSAFADVGFLLACLLWHIRVVWVAVVLHYFLAKWQSQRQNKRITFRFYAICVDSLWSLDRVGFFQIFHTHILVGGASLSRCSSFMLLFKALCSGNTKQKRVKVVLPWG